MAGLQVEFADLGSVLFCLSGVLFLFISEKYSMYGYITVYILILMLMDRHPGPFQFGGIISKATMNVLCKTFLCLNFNFSCIKT